MRTILNKECHYCKDTFSSFHCKMCGKLIRDICQECHNELVHSTYSTNSTNFFNLDTDEDALGYDRYARSKSRFDEGVEKSMKHLKINF